MITMREPGERIRRRYPASIKKMGKGTLYITTRRVVFESRDHGLCLDLHFRWLYEWFPTGNRKCRLSWFEPDPDTKDVRLTDKAFECDVVLERRGDKWKPDPIEFHYSLCFAYTEWVDHEQMQSGWYFGSDGKMRNHYMLAGSKQKTTDTYPGFPDDSTLKWQMVHQAAAVREEVRDYFKGATGERLIDQELKWRGWDTWYEGVQSLNPKRSHPDGTVIPYEPEFERLKDYYPAWRQPTFDELASGPQSLSLPLRASVLDGYVTRMKDEVKEGKLVHGSKEWEGRRRHYYKSLSNYMLDYKLAAKMTEMKFETFDQWNAVRNAARDAFKKSGIEDDADYDAVMSYEPMIIDMPPAEPYKNEELEEKQKYRRLLVEAV